MKKIILFLIILGFIIGFHFEVHAEPIDPSIHEQFCPGSRISRKEPIEGIPVFHYWCANGRNDFEYPGDFGDV